LDEYKQKRKEHATKLAEFYKKNPELNINCSLGSIKDRAKISRLFPDTKDVKFTETVTPFSLYRDRLREGGNSVSLFTANFMWENMNDSEKSKYVTEVANMDITKKKEFTRSELVLIDKTILDYPYEKPPISIKSFLRAKQKRERKEQVPISSLTHYGREYLEEEYKQLKTNYLRKMEKWIRKQPEELQPMLIVQSELYSKLGEKRKLEEIGSDEEPWKKGNIRKNDEAESESDFEYSSTNTNEIKLMNYEPLREYNNVETGSKGCQRETDDFNKPMKRKFCENPKRCKSERKKEPPYPSQFTAHYFMKNVFQGKPHLVAFAYKKLDSTTKKKCRQEMKSTQKAYLLKVPGYIKQLDRERIAGYSNKLKMLKEKQLEEIHWHVSTGTDDEKKPVSSDSSSEDSSSDESDSESS
jgi:hypothetical protein